MSRPAPPWRTVVVGLGWVSRQVWLPRLTRHDRFEVVGAVEPDPVCGPGPDGLTVWPDLAGVPEGGADLALIAVPNHLHAACGAQALRMGMSVLVEKPLCTNHRELGELAAAAASTGTLVATSSAARLRGDVRALAAIVSSGRTGPARLLELSWIRARGVPRPGSWFTNRKLAGGGVLVDLGWHILDVGLDLLGWPGVDDAIGACRSAYLHDVGWRADWRMDGDGPGLPLDVEDDFAGFITVPGGAGIFLRVAWASHEPTDVTSLTVHGDRASVTLRTTFGFSPNRIVSPELVVAERGSVTCEPLPVEPVGVEYDRQLDELDEILSGRRPCGLDHAAQVLDATEALYTSVGRGAA